MTPRTAPRLALDDKRMWRKEMALHHPDRGGDHESFIWIQAVRDFVCGTGAVHDSLRPQTTTEGAARIPYDAALGFVDEFVTLTLRALSVGQHAEEPYRSLLALLIDCPAEEHGRQVVRQERGASYKQLAYIGYLLGLSKPFSRWYEIARSIPLSDQHASHIIGRLSRRAERSPAA